MQIIFGQIYQKPAIVWSLADKNFLSHIQGDSGGPLVCQFGEKDYVIGIFSNSNNYELPFSMETAKKKV